MIKYLTREQLEALEIMENFICEGIPCKDCPLYTDAHGCGSRRATKILAEFEKETKQ